MASKKERRKEFAKYPKYRDAYIRAFDRMLEARRDRGKMAGGMAWGDTGLDVYHWWMEDGTLPNQMVFDGMEEDTL